MPSRKKIDSKAWKRKYMKRYMVYCRFKRYLERKEAKRRALEKASFPVPVCDPANIHLSLDDLEMMLDEIKRARKAKG